MRHRLLQHRHGRRGDGHPRRLRHRRVHEVPPLPGPRQCVGRAQRRPCLARLQRRSRHRRRGREGGRGHGRAPGVPRWPDGPPDRHFRLPDPRRRRPRPARGLEAGIARPRRGRLQGGANSCIRVADPGTNRPRRGRLQGGTSGYADVLPRSGSSTSSTVRPPGASCCSSTSSSLRPFFSSGAGR